MKSRLTVIAGHGGRDVGAVRDVVIAGTPRRLVERDLARDAVLAFNDYASKVYRPNVPVELVTIGAEDPRGADETLLAKIEQVNALGPDQLSIELHLNANAGDNGTQVWYSQFADTTPGDETGRIAPLVLEEMATLIGKPVPLIRSDRSRFGRLGILDDVKATSLLVEGRSVDEFATTTFVYGFGAAIARACARYFSWPATPTQPTQLNDKIANARALAQQLVELLT